MSPIGSSIQNVEAVEDRRPLSLGAAVERVLLGILVVRASLDNLLNAYGGPVGALLNFAVIACAIVLFRVHRERQVTASPFWGLFLAMCAVSVFYTPDKVSAVRFLAVLGTYCAMFLIPCAIVRHERDVVRIIKVILVSSAVPVLLGVLDLGRDRAQSTFPHPNIYAFYLGLIILTVALTWSSRLFTHARAEKGVLLGLAGACGVLLILTQTRSAWLGLAAALAAVAVMYDRRLLIGVFLLPFAALLPQVQERLSDLGETTEFVGNGMIANSYEWRRMLWESAMVWVYQNPIVGHGLNSFSKYSPQFFRWEEEGYNSHNAFVQVLFEMGGIGLFLFIMIFTATIWIAIKNRNKAPEAFTFVIALCIFYGIICYSDNVLYYLSFDWYFWILLGTLRAWLLLPAEVDHDTQHLGPDAGIGQR